MSDTYWVIRRTTRTTLHTDRDCRQIHNSRGTRKATDAEIDRYPVCKICSGEHQVVGGTKDAYRALRDLGQSD